MLSPWYHLYGIMFVVKTGNPIGCHREMKREKFDCVRMKHEIQQQIMKEHEGLSREEQRRLTEERISKDPILGPLWRKSRRAPTSLPPKEK